jgi:hypothetical protein
MLFNVPEGLGKLKVCLFRKYQVRKLGRPHSRIGLDSGEALILYTV